MQQSQRTVHLVCIVVLTFMTLTFSHVTGCPYISDPVFNDVYMSNGHMMECGAGTVYSAISCACVHGISNRPKCQYVANTTDANRYIDSVNGSSFACPSWHEFNNLLCKCKAIQIDRPCTPRFTLNFNTAAVNTVQRYNVGGSESVVVNSGHGTFTPQSAITLWTFKERPFENEIQIQMNFTDDAFAPAASSVLLTNCRAKDNVNKTLPSLLIFLDKSKRNGGQSDLIHVIMRTDVKPQGVDVTVPYRSGEPNVLVVLKAQDQLKVKVLFANGQSAFAYKPLPGTIITSNDYLFLGSCGTAANGFIGKMDWFDYFPCWPRQLPAPGMAV